MFGPSNRLNPTMWPIPLFTTIPIPKRTEPLADVSSEASFGTRVACWNAKGSRKGFGVAF